jgi:acyl-[acyl-carrier-protein] desaturase
MNFSDLTRSEVMKHLEGYVSGAIYDFLKPIEEYWQPTDFLPNASLDNFFDEIKGLQERAKALSYDLMAVLIGDTITEEALPTYESWLFAVDGIKEASEESGWKKWVRNWTAEENRHGDLLNRYLYLTGRVDMREMEISTQYLIADGFNIQTGDDPYRNFVYTSFQELATNISHRRVGTIARKEGDAALSKICGFVAGDEARHAKAYMHFVEKIFELDPNEMMLAFEDMMKKKIVMPAHFLREVGLEVGKTFGHFTDAAQRLGVYTAIDYADILKSLIKAWNIENISGLKDSGEKAREYLIKLPERLNRIAERIKTPNLEYKFKWILA